MADRALGRSFTGSTIAAVSSQISLSAERPPRGTQKSCRSRCRLYSSPGCTVADMPMYVKFYGITDALNCTLQGSSVTAFDAKSAAGAVCQALLGLRSDSCFDSFWENATAKAQELQLLEPAVPRVRRPPRRLDDGSNPASFSSPKDYYRKLYYEFIDCIHGEIVGHFEQENYNLYMKAEQLLLKSASTGEISSEYFEEVCKHYGDDFDHSRLRNQLAVVKDIVNSVTPSLQDIQAAILSLKTTSSLFSEIA